MELELNTSGTSGVQQNRVSGAVWRWQESGREKKVDAAQARRVRAIMQFAGMLAVSFVFYILDRWAGARTLPASVFVLSLALFVLISGLAFPLLFDVFDRLMKGLGKAAGISLTWLLLAPFFFLVFVPARIVLVLRGKDPMKREIRSSETTFWVARGTPRTLDSYRKQY